MSSMKFCPECNNILYPREDIERKILLYACRNCEHEEKATHNCVYRQVYSHGTMERSQYLQEVASDPTLPRTKSVRCPSCDHGEAVFFQLNSNSRNDGMTLYFVCCNPNCGHKWRDDH